MDQVEFVYNPPDTGASILRSAKGTVFTPMLPETGNRVVLILDDEDAAKTDQEGPYSVTDQMTGLVHNIVRTDCGFGCRCAVAIVP